MTHPAVRPGVGIDLAERATFRHLDDEAIRRAADRWLRPGERAWCAAQPSLREALVTVLSCKEAVFKAFSPAPDSHGLSLTMHGGGVRAGPGSMASSPAWWRLPGRCRERLS